MKNFDQEKFDNYILEKIVTPLVESVVDNKKDIYRNTLDPFSALIDCMVRNCTPTDWKNQEERRQTQKTLQNKIGDLHEYVVDCFEGWERLEKGVDVKNEKLKIIAEIKNKWNTTKGSHKVRLYDDLEGQVKRNHKEFTAYYVEILPKNKGKYDKNFTPSDNNKSGERRPSRDDIRIIDGASFYEIVSGEKDFLIKLYKEILPNSLRIAIKEINKNRKDKLKYPKNIEKDPLFSEFIDKAF